MDGLAVHVQFVTRRSIESAVVKKGGESRVVRVENHYDDTVILWEEILLVCVIQKRPISYRVRDDS